MNRFDIKSAGIALLLLGALAFIFPQFMLFSGMMVVFVGLFGGMIGIIGAVMAILFALALPFFFFILVPIAIFLLLYNLILKWRFNHPQPRKTANEDKYDKTNQEKIH